MLQTDILQIAQRIPASALTVCRKFVTIKPAIFAHFADTGGIPLSRPKKQKKTVQERKQAAAHRQAERKKRDDRITYIMMAVILVVVVAFFAAFTFL